MRKITFRSTHPITERWSKQINNAADSLSRTANILALRYIKSLTTANEFLKHTDDFIDQNIAAIRQTAPYLSPESVLIAEEKACMQAIANIKQEEAYLHEQDRMLSGKQARPAIAIELQKNGDAWGYVIKGAGILLSTLEVAAGIGLIATGTPVGILFGAAMISFGANDLQESINDLKGKSNDTGFLKNGFIGTAEFLGFSPEVGRMAYHSVSIVLSGY